MVAPFHSLTDRERDVLTALLSGYVTDQEIADHLILSIHTVGNHLANIFQKCGVRYRAELVILAARSGWFNQEDHCVNQH